MDKELVVVSGKVIEQQRSYTTKVGKDIGYESGAKMVKRHFDQHPDEATAAFMGREIIEGILSQPGCIGLRVFNGVDELGIRKPIFVGADKNGNNILHLDTTRKAIVAGGAKICPPYCGVNEDLEATEEESGSWW